MYLCDPGSDADISIHALLAESDTAGLRTTTALCGFLSTLSLRRATVMQKQYETWFSISIHALLAESDGAVVVVSPLDGAISIHALLAESDLNEKQANQSAHCISIHALLAESD